MQQQQQQDNEGEIQTMIHSPSNLPPAAVRDVVLERPRRGKKKKHQAQQMTMTTTSATTSAIEGYTPKEAVIKLPGTATTTTTNTTTTPASPSSTRRVSIKDGNDIGAPEASSGSENSNSTAPSSSDSLQADPSASATRSGGTDNNNPTDTNTTAGQQQQQNSDKEALILNSLADLLETTSVVPLPAADTPVTTDTTVVEADLQFSVMTPESFRRQKEQECQLQYQIMMGQQHHQRYSTDNNPSSSDKENNLAVTGQQQRPPEMDEDTSLSGPVDDEEEDDSDQEEDNPDNDDDEDNGMDDDYFVNDNMSESDDEDSSTPYQPRAFIILWSALTQWVTPQTVKWLQTWRNLQNQAREMGNNNNNGEASVAATTVDVTTLPTQAAVDRTDLGASRCAGLMAILQMHFNTALAELGLRLEDRRRTERLVGDLLRTFNYSRPSPRLTVAQSKALTAILLHTVIYEGDGAITTGGGSEIESSSIGHAASHKKVSNTVILPASCQGLGLTSDEFHYLTVSAIPNLKTPPPLVA
jgi:hypothetical protein